MPASTEATPNEPTSSIRTPLRTPPRTPPRIASLVPSLTEMLFEVGLGPWVVARTGFCIHPREQVAAVPKVGGTKDVNLAKLRRLAPTHLLVNVDENRRETVDAIAAWSADDGPGAPTVLVTHPIAPHDNLALVDLLLAHFGEWGEARTKLQQLRNSLNDELAQMRPQERPIQRVLYLIWHNPWMTVARDTYIANLLAQVRWETLPHQVGGERGAARYPVVHGDEPWLAEVDQVLLSSEPYAFGAEHLAQAQRLCPNAQVRLVDGEMLSWYGARAVPGLRYLRQIAETAGRRL